MLMRTILSILFFSFFSSTALAATDCRRNVAAYFRASDNFENYWIDSIRYIGNKDAAREYSDMINFKSKRGDDVYLVRYSISGAEGAIAYLVNEKCKVVASKDLSLEE